MHSMAPPTVPVGVPAAIVAGDTVVFDLLAFADSRGPFSSTDGWTAAVHLTAPGKRVAASVASQGSGWRATLAAADTTALKTAGLADPERVQVTVTVTKSGERYTVWTGSAYVKADPATLEALTSADETELAEIKAAIQAIVTGAQSYMVAGRTVTKADLAALYRRRGVLEARLVARETGGLLPDVEVTFVPVG